MEILNFLIPFIILLTVVVFVHEYGHYYFAKIWCRYNRFFNSQFLVLKTNREQDGNFVHTHSGLRKIFW